MQDTLSSERIDNVTELTTGGYFAPVPSFARTIADVSRVCGAGAMIAFRDAQGRRSLASLWDASALVETWGHNNAQWLARCAANEWQRVGFGC